ncbi:unnamed protein product [Boreogadus saida]
MESESSLTTEVSSPVHGRESESSLAAGSQSQSRIRESESSLTHSSGRQATGPPAEIIPSCSMSPFMYFRDQQPKFVSHWRAMFSGLARQRKGRRQGGRPVLWQFVQLVLWWLMVSGGKPGCSYRGFPQPTLSAPCDPGSQSAAQAACLPTSQIQSWALWCDPDAWTPAVHESEFASWGKLAAICGISRRHASSWP